MKKELIAICVTVIACFLGWNAGKADRKEKLIYLVLAFLIYVVNVYIHQWSYLTILSFYILTVVSN